MPKELIQEGSLVRLKSGTEGWVKGQVVEYFDVIPTPGGYMYGGGMTPGYKVHILEGKHKGETIKVPENYVEAVGPSKATLYPHVPKSRQPLFPHVPKGQQPELLPQLTPEYQSYLKALAELRKEYPYPLYTRADLERKLKRIFQPETACGRYDLMPIHA